ncbi:hypothetical protein GCM10010271_67840 [Streptomyces kurssanovii]|nr:hypothetical protein GCM10010271_67840 [Streptomyces kurssanovii]
MTDTEPTVLAGRLGALAHPVRLRILKACLEGVTKASELSALTDMGTTGQVYHHLRLLVGAGWLTTPSRGNYQVPKEHLHLLVAVLTAAAAHPHSGKRGRLADPAVG